MTELSPILMRVTATAVAIGCAITMPDIAQGQNKNVQPKAPPAASLIQKLRNFLGLNPPVAVGGSRSDNEKFVCLVSPWPGTPIGVSTPVLMALGPLNEIRIEKGDQVLWQQRASSTKAIEGVIPWPLKPLEPEEEFTLKIRPQGAAGGDFAIYSMRVSSKVTLEKNHELIRALGKSPQKWINHIATIKPEEEKLVSQIITSNEAPSELQKILMCSK